METNQIRQKFIKYFQDKKHTFFKSDSLIPSSDPTLLFTSAGMVQFKNYFLGKQKLDAKEQRACSVQKCFRTSDIEKVGYTARHLTFFEMLGNFSFGDYFKKEAVAWAWEFLVKEIALDPARLYVSVYKEDSEAFDIWAGIVAKNRIIKLGDESNFWQMGDTGPCGPCSEILYDTGSDKGCGKKNCSPGCDCDRFLEIWNLVFTQFDRMSDGSLKNLPRKNIDTGMGLERLASVSQNAPTNFRTDELIKITDFVKNILFCGDVPESRVIADHGRGATFLIADGILPSNEARGYVLRRIIRRAVTKGKKSGINNPFLYSVCDKVIDTMKLSYPDIATKREQIVKIVKMEEEKFLLTLEKGMDILNSTLKKNQNITGADAFALYDTYGFPFDLTKEIAAESGLKVDEKGFETEMEKQKVRSKTSWAGSGEKDAGNYYEIHKKTGNTLFKGYDSFNTVAEVLVILKNNKHADFAKEGDDVEIITNETVFYGESGGQVGDTGKIVSSEGNLVIEVYDTQKPVENLIVHKCKIIQGNIKTGDTVKMEIAISRRRNIMKNHTVTHLLHAALRNILGQHALQRGSLVAENRFRFDFLHPVKIKENELYLIEKYVNERILANNSVNTKITDIAGAKSLGATALFGEKYGELVRCVIIGDEKKPESIELCGGTHCSATGEIGQFQVVAESSIGSGLRRIEGITGHFAYEYAKSQRDILEEASELLKTSPSAMIEKLKKQIAEKKKLEKEFNSIKNSVVSSCGAAVETAEIKGIKVLFKVVESGTIPGLRNILDSLHSKNTEGITLAGAIINEKPVILISVSKNLVPKITANSIAKELSSILGGGGGGKQEFAQAGGRYAEKLPDALASMENILDKFL